MRQVLTVYLGLVLSVYFVIKSGATDNRYVIALQVLTILFALAWQNSSYKAKRASRLKELYKLQGKMELMSEIIDMEEKKEKKTEEKEEVKEPVKE